MRPQIGLLLCERAMAPAPLAATRRLAETDMKTTRLALLSLLLLAPLAARAAEAPRSAVEAAKIIILAPTDGATLDADESYPLQYEVTPGPGGDHFHVWVDGDRGPGVHDRKGTYALPKLAPGVHTITIKVVDKGHVPTGPEKTIKVKVAKA
jgi:hypothetical protein